jgi:hypothetical protein
VSGKPTSSLVGLYCCCLGIEFTMCKEEIRSILCCVVDETSLGVHTKSVVHFFSKEVELGVKGTSLVLQILLSCGLCNIFVLGPFLHTMKGDLLAAKQIYWVRSLTVDFWVHLHLELAYKYCILVVI